VADDFGLGTAGPANWGILEIGSGTVSMADGGTSGRGPGGISVSPFGDASAANLGINSGGKFTAANVNVINGTYYRATGNNADVISGTTNIVGGIVQSVAGNSIISAAASSAISASANLSNTALNPATQTVPGNVITTTTTLTGVSGRNVLYLSQLNLAGTSILTLTAAAGATDVSWVINVSSTLSLAASSQLLLAGGVTPANVILNETTNTPIVVTTTGTVNGIFMGVVGNAGMDLDNSSINGEVISNGPISMKGAADVEVVAGVPEPSAAAYFTLGPLTLIAVMLLHRRFSRRKRTIVRGSYDPPESVLGTVKWC
jgi:hypothetical protein